MGTSILSSLSPSAPEGSQIGLRTLFSVWVTHFLLSPEGDQGDQCSPHGKEELSTGALNISTTKSPSLFSFSAGVERNLTLERALYGDRLVFLFTNKLPLWQSLASGLPNKLVGCFYVGPNFLTPVSFLLLKQWLLKCCILLCGLHRRDGWRRPSDLTERWLKGGRRFGGWLLWWTQQGEQTLCPGCDIVWMLLSETAKWNSLPCCPPSHPTSFSWDPSLAGSETLSPGARGQRGGGKKKSRKEQWKSFY